MHIGERLRSLLISQMMLSQGSVARTCQALSARPALMPRGRRRPTTPAAGRYGIRLAISS